MNNNQSKKRAATRHNLEIDEVAAHYEDMDRDPEKYKIGYVKKKVQTFFLRLRWVYFRWNPAYTALILDAGDGRTETHYYHHKTNSLHADMFVGRPPRYDR
jgi:hypothetical protein